MPARTTNDRDMAGAGEGGRGGEGQRAQLGLEITATNDSSDYATLNASILTALDSPVSRAGASTSFVSDGGMRGGGGGAGDSGSGRNASRDVSTADQSTHQAEFSASYTYEYDSFSPRAKRGAASPTQEHDELQASAVEILNRERMTLIADLDRERRQWSDMYDSHMSKLRAEHQVCYDVSSLHVL